MIALIAMIIQKAYTDYKVLTTVTLYSTDMKFNQIWESVFCWWT